MSETKIKLESERLLIIPLSHNQVLEYRQADGSLEAEFGLVNRLRILPPELKDALDQTIIPALQKKSDNILFVTLWIIINKNENVLVGDLCFKGQPDEGGEVEIGYGVYEQFFNQGFMTEAIGTVTRWAFLQPGIKSITAETEKNNLPSQKVLVRNNFQPYKETLNMQWWRIDKT